MLATSLADDIATLLADLDKAEPLTEGITIFAKVADGLVEPHLRNIAAGGKDLGSYGAHAHNYLAAAHPTLGKVLSRRFYDALKLATRALNDFAEKQPEAARRVAADLAFRLDAFGHVYETYIHNPVGANALTAIYAAKVLLSEFQAFRATIDGICIALQTPQFINGDEAPYTAYFPEDQSLADVAMRLRALHDIFEQLADLVIPRRPDPAVRVLRIESGSLLVVLAVSRSVLAIARPWIASLANFYYRHNVPEGSLKHSPDAAKQAIKKTLDVRKMLQEAGVNIDGMDAPLEAAGTALAERVAVLVKNQHRFRLGDDEFEARVVPTLPVTERPKLAPPKARELEPPDKK